MSEENKQNQGLQVAHSPPEISAERAAKIGSAAAMTETVMADLAQTIAGGRDEPEQHSLLLADPDGEHCLFGGPVRHVASIMDTAKRARGRPKGAQNKRSADLANYILGMGYRDPALNLADLANADPLGLVVEMAALPMVEGATPQQVLAAAIQQGMLEREEVGKLAEKALKLVKDANGELMPFFHAKKPQEVHVKESVLGVMMIGEMPTTRPDEGAFMNLTAVDAPEEKG